MSYEEWVMARGDPSKELGNIYNVLALAGEAGELANYAKKQWAGRGDYTKDMRLEIGDILYYLIRVCHDLGIDLAEAQRLNMEKITAREAKRMKKL